AYAMPSEALAALAGRFETYLARHGHPCPPDRPWQEHLALPAPSPNETKPTPPLDRERAEAFIQTYNKARFGDGEADQAVMTLQETLQQMENARQ
nr:hypothetical protein [Armatimonadota bacterium]